MPVEGLPQDLPLLGVGVLEFVDQHDAEPVAHPAARSLAVLGVEQNAVQQRQLVVEVAQSHAPFAGSSTSRRTSRAKATRSPARGALCTLGGQVGLRIEDRGALRRSWPPRSGSVPRSRP